MRPFISWFNLYFIRSWWYIIWNKLHYTGLAIWSNWSFSISSTHTWEISGGAIFHVAGRFNMYMFVFILLAWNFLTHRNFTWKIKESFFTFCPCYRSVVCNIIINWTSYNGTWLLYKVINVACHSDSFKYKSQWIWGSNFWKHWWIEYDNKNILCRSNFQLF